MSNFATSSGVLGAQAETVTVDIGRFAFEALGGSDEGNEAVVARLSRAVDTYWADRPENRPGWVYPAAVQDHDPQGSIALQMTIKATLMEELAREARRRAISTDQLINHAALYYVAELDARRPTQRILDGLPEADPEALSPPTRPS